MRTAEKRVRAVHGRLLTEPPAADIGAAGALLERLRLQERPLLSREAATRQALLRTGETDLRAGRTRRHRTVQGVGDLASGRKSADFGRVRALRLKPSRQQGVN